jgi:hypothetical protein
MRTTDYESKLNEAIKKHEEYSVDMKKHAELKYAELKNESQKILDLVLIRIKPEFHKYVKSQVNFGDCRPSESTAYILFDNITSITKVQLKFDDEMYRLLAFHIDKTNNIVTN